MSFERFSRRMLKRAANVPREANRVKRQVALAVDQAVVVGTPVDTGTARSNWIVSLGEAVDNVIEPYAPTSKGGVNETANARAAMAQGEKEIRQSKPEEAIHITNNVDYIEPLNQGHSAQAPAMFVESAVDAGVQAARNARINTGRPGR
jgi:hypothetical protein